MADVLIGSWVMFAYDFGDGKMFGLILKVNLDWVSCGLFSKCYAIDMSSSWLDVAFHPNPLLHLGLPRAIDRKPHMYSRRGCRL
jgi:hypothetical protein